MRSLSSGRTSAKTSSMPRSRADGLGDLSSVAGDHHDPLDTHLVQLVDGLAGFGTDLVLQGERADDHGVTGEVEHRRPPAAHSSTDVWSSAGTGEAAFAKQRGPADRVADAVDGGFDAAARQRPKAGGVRNLAVLAGGRHDGPGERVLAVGFDGGGEAQDVAGRGAGAGHAA